MKRRTFLNRALHTSMALVAAGALAGCGFQLRGQGRNLAGLDSLALDAPPGPLADAVRQALEGAGVAVHAQAPWRLNLGAEQLDEINLTANNAGSRTVELQLGVPFSVQRQRDDAYRLERQTLTVSTTYEAGTSDLLARDDRRERAVQSLRQEAARRLIDRLQSLADAP
ncbi:LPS assembly lipoprotein LptE [Modicisalibacter tunisiensis]|uniref:LPS-assembly lipoprotein LptE n=1 Tax=Modicisalibacter tunisiensis TaxID=390637 RepID=A0ABS7X1H5_9GAMM|nr:LPS assembly lipoprotein LptE [Modicisalibacter tunisiensis]MBZ9568745.1 hypothetical protein [Modicisalibacter tunisiensis]